MAAAGRVGPEKIKSRIHPSKASHKGQSSLSATKYIVNILLLPSALVLLILHLAKGLTSGRCNISSHVGKMLGSLVARATSHDSF